MNAEELKKFVETQTQGDGTTPSERGKDKISAKLAQYRKAEDLCTNRYPKAQVRFFLPPTPNLLVPSELP